MNALAAIRPVVDEAPAPALARDLNGILRLLTCGSVDDGKSTLIGRLLWDASDLYEDQRETLSRAGRTAANGTQPDFSLLVDGLVAEREQGITIDIAWRYFDTPNRRFVVIDSPGHEQYTRNMASGASHADVAIMLVDARAGIKRQTKRHAAILDLVGVRRVVLAVNKMDLVDWSEARFRAIEADFQALTRRFGFTEAIAIPVAAVLGDNVAALSTRMPWYPGPTLLAHLEALPTRASDTAGPFRMPVQMVLRDAQDFRGLAGTISAGTIATGDEVVDAESGRRARVARIVTMDGELRTAAQGHAVVLQLDTDLDISRGAVLAAPASPPLAARRIEARLVWLSDIPLDTDHGYLFRTATDLVPVSGLEIKARLDLETLAQHPAGTCVVNDIAVAEIALGRATALDLFTASRETGSFMLVDAISGATVAGGVVAAAHRSEAAEVAARFVLTRAMLVRGLCADLGGSAPDDREFRRRAAEVAQLMRAAGVDVVIET
jgi:bifunctional enzyme CysN/CysC